MIWVAIPGASRANGKPNHTFIRRTRWTNTHAHVLQPRHTQICFLTPATSPNTPSPGIARHRAPSARALRRRQADVFLFEKSGSSWGAELWLTDTPPKLGSTSFFVSFFDKIKSNYYLDIIFFGKVIRTLLFIQY